MKFNLRQDPMNDDYIIDSEETLLDLSNMNASMIRLAVDEKTQTVYFGYRRIVYSFDLEERKKTEFYEFEDGIPVDMSFDPITGNLYALVVNYRKELCTGEFSDPVSAIAIFPTFARKYSRHPYIQTLPSLYSDGIIIIPQFMEIVPEENVIFVSTPNDIYRIAFDIHSFDKEPTLSTKVTKLKLKSTNQLNYFEQVNFDRQRGRLLIFERVESKIISCDSYGEHCNESPRHALKEISQIAILGKTAIFSEFKRPEIVSMDLFNPMKTRVIKRTPVEIFYSIRLMHDQYYNPTNILNDDICDRKNCEFMCVTTPPRGFSRSLGLEDTFQTDAHFGLLGAVCMCPDGSISNKTRTCQDPSNATDEISDIFAFSVRSNGENRVTRSGRASKKTKLDIVVTNLQTKSSHSIDLRDDKLHSFTLSNRFSQPVYIPWSKSIGFHHSDESRYFKLMQLPEYQCVDKFQNLELAFDDVKILTKEISTSNLVYLIDTDGYKLYETDDIIHPRYIPDLDIICGIAALHSDRKPVKAVVCWHQNVHENDDFADMNMFTVVFTHSDDESSYKLHDFYADVYGFTAVLTKRQSESSDVEGRDLKVFTKILFHAWSNYTLGITDTITTSFKVEKSSYDKNLMARIWDFDLRKRTALMSYANTIRYFYPNSTSVRDFSYHEYVIRSSSNSVTVSSMTRFGDRFIGVYQRFKEKSGGYLSNDVIFDCNLSEQAMNNPCKPFIKLPDHFTEKYSVTQDNMITLFLNKTDIPRRSWNQKHCYNTCGELLCVPQKDKIPITCLCHEGHIWDKEKKMCTKGIEICKGFVCAISRKCIEPNKICDWKFDCDDNFRGVLGLSEDDKSDEMNCQNTCSR